MAEHVDNAKAFRNALASFATGVTIVTAIDDKGSAVGVTANSFNSVSLEPALVLWSLAKKARSFPVYEKAKHFAIHVLADNQMDLSNRFATPQADKFLGLKYIHGRGGVPLLEGCVSQFQCETRQLIDGGDHVIFLGEVVEFCTSNRNGLLYHNGKYSISRIHPDIDTSLTDGQKKTAAQSRTRAQAVAA